LNDSIKNPLNALFDALFVQGFFLILQDQRNRVRYVARLEVFALVDIEQADAFE